MDFDYQKVKDAEDKQREERVRALPIPAMQPVPAGTQDLSTARKPPIKPRRSIKCRPGAQQETGPPSNPAVSQTGSEVVAKRLSPALMLGPSGPLEALSPSLRAHTLLWFHRSQLPRLQTEGQPLPQWLHGFATRREAEQLLHDQPLGCFLLRLSESKIGFVLSYRGKDRCRHFIIEEEEDSHRVGEGGKYVIAGERSRHCSLQDLINYYTLNPVGPFDEMLTVPYTKTNGLSEDIVRKRVGVSEQVNDMSRQAHSASPSPNPASAGGEVVSKEMPEYAVVRKALRKSHSLPESPTGPLDVAPPIAVQAFSPPSQRKESPVCPVDRPPAISTPCDSTDVPYARVNKPLRAAQTQAPVPTPGLQAAMAPLNTAGSPPQPSAEQKYWHLEPEHTYEETPGNQEHIDFYAVGRRREVEQSNGDSRNHVYSEVNLCGSRPGLPHSSPEPAPLRQHSRLPPRPISNPNTFSRPDSNAMQNFGGGVLSTSPSRSGDISPYSTSRPSAATADPSPIYEQIPARMSGPRPPLPPPNPKH
ncbi:SH2 domain-containing protein 2A [Engraulis encrasicolus]|uniref:SH2 domain-containing protein 2A n=1 Tax=Engraulis encrasicolus TaxID=184585 RepID=UPI002FD37DD4